MKRIHTLILLLFAALLLIPAAQGQDDGGLISPKDPDMVNPEVNITFPPPVYVLSGSVDIRGTVSIAELRQFFIEFRSLALDMEAGEDQMDDPWLPADLPRITAVTDDILGSWNTITLQDGLYELRLAINPNSETPTYFRVSPLRVENNPPPFVAAEQTVVVVEPVAEEETQVEEAVAEEPDPAPEPEPEATETPDPRPRVIALVNSNVRAGDSILYTIVGGLHEDDSAIVKGISSFGTGWFYIELDNGRSGFIHPNIVRTEGDFSSLARINPPPLPPTPIPVPTAVPAPAQLSSGANLVIQDPTNVSPHPATCGVGYSITVTVANIGNGAATSGGEIKVTDSTPGQSERQSTEIAFGPLAAGASQTVNGYLTPTTHYGAKHNITMRLDHTNAVAETNENDNLHAEPEYILVQGDCG